MIPIHKHNKKPYKFPKIFNEREKIVAEEYYNNGFIVLKNGWPDLFCYNPITKEIELLEIKSKNQYQETKNGKKLGLTKDQLRMHQYLKKAGFKVKIIHI